MLSQGTVLVLVDTGILFPVEPSKRAFSRSDALFLYKARTRSFGDDSVCAFFLW